MRTKGSSPPVRLGAAVRAQRRRLGLTQRALSELADVGLAFLYDLEQGKPTVRLDKVLAVLRVLGLELHIRLGKEVVSSSIHPPDPVG